MPYIMPSEREVYDKVLTPLLEATAGARTGALNYVITRILDNWLHGDGGYYGYDGVNSVLGILEAAKLEFYRRVGARYEDTKIAQNGDVYGR